MRSLTNLFLSLMSVLLVGSVQAQELISNVPRHQTLVVENPEGTIKNAGWFNIWAINAGGQSTGLHQLAMDTFWYIDPNRGINGVWDNSLASEKPIDNANFTEMTVKLLALACAGSRCVRWRAEVVIAAPSNEREW